MPASKSKKKRFIEAEDITRFSLIKSIALSPDEKRVAYTVQNVSDNKRKYYSRLHVADCHTGETRQYTFGEIADRDPVWSPDGRQIAFVSTRDEKTAIYVIPTGGGAERKVLEKDGSFAGLTWTPDGGELVFAFRQNDPREETDDEKKKKEPPLYRHITTLLYKFDGEGFLPQDKYHIWKVDVESGQDKQLTRGQYNDFCPDVSPDGRRIVYTSNRVSGDAINRSYFDLFLIPVNGGRPKKIPTPPGPALFPSFSPDGKKIAYHGHDRPDLPWGIINQHVWLVGTSGRPEARDLTPRFDRFAAELTISDLGGGLVLSRPFWSADGKRVYFIASDLGSSHLFYAPARGGLPTRVTQKKCHVSFCSMNGRGKKAAVLYSDVNNTTEIHLLPAVHHGDKKAEKIVRPDRRLLAGINQPKTREIWFKGHDGFELQGWLVTPPNFNRRRKYPAILEIHGGPQLQYGFTFFHEMKYLASHGYVVFYTNPRGGQGRGRTFVEAIYASWGEIDYMDCMSAADYLEKLPYVNKNRIGVTGGSYGGFMTNWMIGHTDRFRAAVTQRSVVNLVSKYGTGDVGVAFSRIFDGHPWEKPEIYKKHSPLTYAKNIKTPLLIIHSENDLRCNIGQAEELFTTLKVLKKKVEFVRFPGEPHGLSRGGRPDRRIARLEWILKWFDKYLK